MSKTFFVSWELWQQMTFVLGASIVVVVLLGLIKLLWIHRFMKKQEVLDEEKRARLVEMRKTGLSAKRACDIPFGVRATQAGIEVDGIWVSRPSTPNPNASTTSLASPLLPKGKSLDPQSATSARPSILRSPSANNSPSEYFDAPSGLGRHKSTHQRSDSGLNSDALRMLEGKPPRAPNNMQTYTPKAGGLDSPQQRSRSQPRQAAAGARSHSHSRQPGSGSSSGDSYASTSSPSPTRGQYMYAASSTGPSRSASAVNLATHNHPIIPNFPLSSPDREHGGGLGSPYMPSSGAGAASESQLPLLPYADALSMPEPTFGPGDLRYGQKSRPFNGQQ